jgi:hypothetical protein
MQEEVERLAHGGLFCKVGKAQRARADIFNDVHGMGTLRFANPTLDAYL